MRKDGTGRSNALPVTQVVLGTALAVLGVLGGLFGSWIEWLVAACGAAQAVLGVHSYRHNNRLDAEEDANRALAP